MERIEKLEKFITKLKNNKKINPLKVEAMEWELRALKAEAQLKNCNLQNVSGSDYERYRKALGYISEMTFEIEIGTEKGSDVLEKALRIASGYNVD